uniref:EF-hand domain-containing protein n=1 Tax=Oryza punctata TaxID=4537 RepID=A0A0E0MC98_ORYPU
MAGYPPNPGSGYPYGGAGGGYGAPPPPYGSSPAPSAPPYGEKPPKEGKTSSSSSAPYYGGGGGYGAPPSTQPYGSGAVRRAVRGPAAVVGALRGARRVRQPVRVAGAVGVPSRDGSQRGGAADRDGSGMIDDKELQSALSGYSQSFSLRTVHLLMYLFTNTNVRKIGPKEFTSVFYSLQNWRSIFERFDRDRSGKIDATELRDALLSLGYSVSPTVLDLLVSKFDKTGGKNKAIEYDNFIECCLTVKGLTEKFKEKDTAFSGSATFTYEAFMLTVLPFLIA